MNLGKYLSMIIKQQGRSKSWVAAQAEINYKTFVDKLKRNSINGEELLIIAVILDIDLNELKNKTKETGQL